MAKTKVKMLVEIVILKTSYGDFYAKLITGSKSNSVTKKTSFKAVCERVDAIALELRKKGFKVKIIDHDGTVLSNE